MGNSFVYILRDRETGRFLGVYTSKRELTRHLRTFSLYLGENPLIERILADSWNFSPVEMNMKDLLDSRELCFSCKEVGEIKVYSENSRYCQDCETEWLLYPQDVLDNWEYDREIIDSRKMANLRKTWGPLHEVDYALPGGSSPA